MKKKKEVKRLYSKKDETKIWGINITYYKDYAKEQVKSLRDANKTWKKLISFTKRRKIHLKKAVEAEIGAIDEVIVLYERYIMTNETQIKKINEEAKPKI